MAQADISRSAAQAPSAMGAFRALQIDPRLLGMIGALLIIWIGFDVLTGGLFLTPRNLFNLSVQTASVAVMATGMVFIIVMRHIDLSVGAMLGVIGMLMGWMQAQVLPDLLGFGSWAIAPITVLFGATVGALIGAGQGYVVGYLGVPAFIVTLGGLLIWRGAAWWVTSGQTVAPLDANFVVLGGGLRGTLGAEWSWMLAALACAATVALIAASRRRKIARAFPVKPLWAELTVGAILLGLIVSFTAIMNAYDVPQRAAERLYQSRGLTLPEGMILSHGIAVPVIIVLIVAVAMTVIARRTRFGRYVFAAGGNPDAADLAGVDTRKLTVKVFALMGFLTAIAAVIASARLQSAANDLGTLDELRVIAAAVIGGTALSGGIGTIYGAILGALVMQSLQSGMAMVGVDAPLQSIVVGVVLVVAVLADIVYRRRVGD
ncbi:MAG: sugar ABC transporter permease [Rubrimonas sp.]|uniref:sugar ABC transporter permease n=1 Tax=Rubrimonas sp. TaxID=2036015 RepID=UPI003DD21FAE